MTPANELDTIDQSHKRKGSDYQFALLVSLTPDVAKSTTADQITLFRWGEALGLPTYLLTESVTDCTVVVYTCEPTLCKLIIVVFLDLWVDLTEKGAHCMHTCCCWGRYCAVQYSMTCRHTLHYITLHAFMRLMDGWDRSMGYLLS